MGSASSAIVKPDIGRGSPVMTPRGHESVLREKAREAIRTGTLPARRPDRRFGGAGGGGLCAVCGEPVTQDQMEVEMEFNRHGVTPGLDSYRLHPRCYMAWDFERTNGETASG
jgi:hypothetical protein